nr:PREDICTED: transcription elongation factor A protein 2 [Latimeria chalumnae]|eukprot:XP_014353065.1 PREDICTED: transcription elongation factor A protein 2 [Latimeria chalumnae]
MDLLQELKNIPMTLDMLQSTRIGMSVNAVRKQSSEEEVITLAKSLIKSWKKLLGVSPPSSNKKPDTPKTPTTPKMTTFPAVPVTTDAVRTKCREMLIQALQTDNDYIAIGTDCDHMAGQIEEYILFSHLFCKFLRYICLYGRLKVLHTPVPENIFFFFFFFKEMASNELKEMRKALTKEAIREHQMAKTGGTQTDLFTCGKCKKKNCTYTQVQIRSADEPMTTFVVCNECGNRWKVSTKKKKKKLYITAQAPPPPKQNKTTKQKKTYLCSISDCN